MKKSSNTKSTTNQTTHTVQTPNNPEFVTRGLEGLGGQISNLSGADPYSFVAGPDALQTQAAAGAASLGNFAGYGTQPLASRGPMGQPAGQPMGGPSPFAPPSNAGGVSSDPMGSAPVGGWNPANGMAAQKDAARAPDPFAGGAPSSGNPYGDAMNTLRGISTTGGSSVQAGDIAGGIPALMNPYVDMVRNTALNDYNQGAGYTRAENKLSLAGDTTFGGSGGAIQTMLSNDAIDRGRGTLSAGIMKDGFDRAAALAAQQAGLNQSASLANGQLNEQALSRRGDAAMGLSGVAGAQGADTRANIGTQADVGSILQQLAQNRATAPLSLLGTQAALFGGLPLNLLNGQTQDGTMSGTSTSKTTLSDPMGSLGGLMSAGGSLASGLGSLGLGFGKVKVK